LTDRGRDFLAALLLRLLTAPLGDTPARDFLVVGRPAPRYEQETRQLLIGARVVKRFRQPSVNQELVLLTAEELDWPEWFDDPLPREGGRCPKARLRDTIKALNRHQTPYLVHFKGDGTGTRIGWELR
jgi:hypothetical protein